jgi:hypothetical protein
VTTDIVKDIKINNTPTNLYRLDISSGQYVNEENHFYVMQALDSGVTPLPVLDKSTASVNVGQIGDYVLATPRDPNSVSDLSYTYTPNGKSITHYVFGLIPDGSYQVISTSSQIVIKQGTGSKASASGVLTFQTLGSVVNNSQTFNIYNVSVGSVAQSTATISWTTSEIADTQVEYGTTLSYGSSSTLKDNVTRVTSHSVSLTGLTPNTTYNYRVKSRDASGNLVISENQTFKTLAIGQTSSKPTGSFDGVDTTKAFGWASDSDTPNTGIDIHLYIDKNAGTAGATPILVKADQNRSDVGDHAFNYVIPEQYRDSKPHSIWAWAIDSSGVGANNIQLAGSPKSFTLAPTVVIQPPPVPTATTTNVLRTIHIDLEGTTLKVATGVIQFVNSTNGTVVKEIPFTTNTNGDFSFYVPISLPSTIFIRVKITGYLPKKLDSPDLTTATPSTLNIPKLPAGDFNGDWVINSFDYAFLSQNWYKPAPSYDINQDGVINSLDYSILSRNWNKIGE